MDCHAVSDLLLALGGAFGWVGGLILAGGALEDRRKARAVLRTQQSFVAKQAAGLLTAFRAKARPKPGASAEDRLAAVEQELVDLHKLVGASVAELDKNISQLDDTVRQLGLRTDDVAKRVQDNQGTLTAITTLLPGHNVWSAIGALLVVLSVPLATAGAIVANSC